MWSKLSHEHQVLSLMLFFGLIMGLLYAFLVPPWQHYDEPTHLENIWLIANQPGYPQSGDYDQHMRREVAASMIESDFFWDMDFRPNLLSQNKPIWIGISQTGSVSIYYWLAALPLRIIRFADIVPQMHLVRIYSLGLYLVTILAAYGIAIELTPAKHPLRWLLPTTILFLPSFTDLMTAANDDVGAVAFFSLFLWAGIRLIKQGFSWARLLLLLFLAVICFFTKNTVYIALGLIIIPILFSLLKGRNQRYVWITLVIILPLIFIGLMTWGDAAHWYRTNLSAGATRASHPDAPLGKNAIRVMGSNTNLRAKVDQLIPVSEIEAGEITVGAWIWAEKPAAVRTPILSFKDEVVFLDVQVTEEPRFFSYTTKFRSGTIPAKLSLSPLEPGDEGSNTVYFDGIVLAPGSRPSDEPPDFFNDQGSHGEWGGEPFRNHVRNPSAEEAGLMLRPWVNRLLKGRVPGNPALLIGLLLDPEPINFYYVATVKSLTQSFWAKFGWGNIIIQGFRPYTVLGFITWLGLVGAVFSFWKNRDNFPWDIAVFLGAATVAIWLLALIRGLSSLVGDNFFVPVARYAYPAVIPTMLVLNIGWLEIIRGLEKYLKIPHQLMYALLIIFFLALNAISLVTISRFFIS